MSSMASLQVNRAEGRITGSNLIRLMSPEKKSPHSNESSLFTSLRSLVSNRRMWRVM